MMGEPPGLGGRCLRGDAKRWLRGLIEDHREPTGGACLMIKSSEKRTRLTFLTHDAMLACWGWSWTPGGVSRERKVETAGQQKQPREWASWCETLEIM